MVEPFRRRRKVELTGTALPHPCGKPAAYRYSNPNIKLFLNVPSLTHSLDR
jgi:hypothetical protein